MPWLKSVLKQRKIYEHSNENSDIILLPLLLKPDAENVENRKSRSYQPAKPKFQKDPIMYLELRKRLHSKERSGTKVTTQVRKESWEGS